MPRRVELLHEKGISFPGGRFPDLLDSDVASGPDNVAHIDEVIAHEAILGDLSLLSFMAIMDCDNCARGSVWCWKDCCCAWLDNDGVIVIEAMDFECLIVIGLIMDVDVMHGLGSRVPEDQ